MPKSFIANVDGDTLLMRAVRQKNYAAVEAILAADDSDKSTPNRFGETPLFLALRAGDLRMIELLHRSGAAETPGIVADPREMPRKPSPRLDFLDQPSPDEAARAYFAGPPDVRALQFTDLVKVRRRIAALVDSKVPRFAALPPLDQDQATYAEDYRTDLVKAGLVCLDQLLDAEKVRAIRDYFDARPCFPAHFFDPSIKPEMTPGKLADVRSASRYATYSSGDIIRAPYLWEIANHPVLLNAVGAYLGCTPTLWHMNVYWSFPRDDWAEEIGDLQSVHRDYDDYETCALFIYLNDVDPDSGPHQYYRGTHEFDRTVALLRARFSEDIARSIANDLFRSMRDGYGRTSYVDELFAAQRQEIIGPAGTAFMIDTFGLHRGLVPRTRPRLMAWARYSIYCRTPSQFMDARERVPGRGYNSYINRIMSQTEAGMGVERAYAAR